MRADIPMLGHYRKKRVHVLPANLVEIVADFDWDCRFQVIKHMGDLPDCKCLNHDPQRHIMVFCPIMTDVCVVCTLFLSCDPDLEQAIRVLPGQAGRFCRRYFLFIFAVNGIVASIYLCSWQCINGGIGLADLGIVALFALQSAILSVILEWKYPLRNWKTESDLWHHPRKYLVPLVMLLLAIFVATWTVILWIWSAVLLMECCILLYVTRR